jgi:hypothetical protein
MRLRAVEPPRLPQTPKNIMAYIPTPDVVAFVRRRYAEGVPIRVIVAESGIKNLNILYRCFAGHYPDGSGINPAPIPQRRQGVRVRHRLGSRAALVSRMWRTAERQVEEIEDRLAVAGIELAERESNARTLAIVAKTLRELAAVDDKPRGKETAKDDDDEAPPRNIDDLRRALAEKLEAFVAGTVADVPDDAG